jgi:DNA-directed RNA polymerase subunit E'
MYKIMTFEETVRIPPHLFGLKLDQAALTMLREQYERTVDKKYGIIVGLHDARIKSEGRVIHGDGAAYFEVEFDALVFSPEVNEVIDGKVSEIVEFGAFVRLGPIDGLIHVSQLANDFFTFDKKNGNLVGRESKKTIKKGDTVRSKIATVSIKDTIPNSNIALTMRSEGLAEKRAGERRGARKR